jgi:hypothetical protein
METIEILIYIAFAIVVGGLLIHFLIDLPVEDTHEKLANKVLEKDTLDMKKGNQDEFVKTILKFWKDNKYKDSTVSTTFYFTDQGLLDKTVLFDKLSSLHQCESIQSAEMKCGFREDVIIGSISTPAIIRIKYENDTLIISPQKENFEKKYNSYDFIQFGGFEGQGIITKKTKVFPKYTLFLGIKMKINSGSDFKVFINNEQCNSIFETFNIVDRFDISSCKSLLFSGKKNNITLKFPKGGHLMKYFGGGYIQIDYMTLQPEEQVYRYYDFPGIFGSINLYSSYYIPGELTNMEAYLHYYIDDTSNQDIELVLGDSIILQDSDKMIEKTVTISNSELESMMNFNDYSFSTIPLRLSSSQEIIEIINDTVEIIPVDVVLITDLSGSMDDDLDSSGGGVSFCGNLGIRKRDVAECVDALFVDIVLNDSSNRLGLAAYGENCPDNQIIPLTSQKNILQDKIETYSDTSIGYTCLSCGIQASIQMFGSSTINKTIVVMTDGNANRCVQFGDPSNSYDCGGSEARNQAIELSNDARALGIEVYAIAFGEDADTTTMEQIANDADHYAQGNDAGALEKIYLEIAQQIVNKPIRNKTLEIVQTIHSSLNMTQNSTLYPDSYIQFEYLPDSNLGGLEDIQFRVETKLSNCNNNLNLPTSFETTQSYILSFSGMFWTKSVDVNSNIAFDLFGTGNTSLQLLGDPFQIYIKPEYMNQGANTINIVFTGDISQDIGCWNPVYNDNSFIYHANLIDGVLPSGATKSNGCKWEIEFENGKIKNYRIPMSYGGNEQCYFTSTSQVFNDDDAISWSVFQLMNEIDTDNDFILPIEIENIQYYDYIN